MKKPRWRVAVLDDHARSRDELACSVREAGGVVTANSDSSRDAVALVTRSRPHVAVFAVGFADGDGVAAAERVLAEAPTPIVLFTSHRGDALIERSTRASVMGYLLKPLRREEVPPALDLAIARFSEIRLLRRRLEARTVIERAKGLLMARQGLTEKDAFGTLRLTAMNRRRSMAEIAEAVILAESMTPELGAK
jgi:response regulator NasT